ncbi:MAG TPA: family 16 glycoside hydrolase [Planctomycetota bacterium]
MLGARETIPEAHVECAPAAIRTAWPNAVALGRGLPARPLRPWAVAGLLLAAACNAPPPPPAAAPGAASGVILPFDGTTLAGWEGDARFWRVEDGALVGESTAANPCAETTYLVWRGGQVVDFELELEWRFVSAEGANSGVQFRSRAPSPQDVTGYQADLETGPDWTGGLYEQGGRGVVTRRGQRVVLDAAGGRSVEPFQDAGELLARVRPGAWNRLRITAFGPRLTFEVNDELFSETIDLDPARAARHGSLALQLHAGPPMRVEFRDLRLRLLSAPPSAEAAASARPAWIWPSAAVADGQRAWFRRRFELPGEPVRAELWLSGDNFMDAWLGGQGVATSDDWFSPVRVEVRAWLHAGENELLVHVENREAEAGLVLTLDVELADGRRIVLVSDGAFEACLEPPGGIAEAARGAWLGQEAPWGAPVSFGALGVLPWGTLGEALSDDGEAPEAATITVPPGFTVERLYSVPRASQGSWVSLTVDPRGRFYASDQYGDLYRLTLAPQGSGEPPRVERIPIALGEAHGLLWAFDALYAVVAGAGEFQSGLHRARDTDGDDELDHVELLRAFEGDGEHGPHGIVLHPDGRSLVIVGGNHTELPEPLDRSRVPRHWAEDVLLPPLDDPGGHAVGIRAPGGWVVRTDPDGREWELVAVGLRNAYDLAFDARGELFTFDSDMEWDLGLPWYRPTRILHVVSGADFGWRAGSAKWPADSFDSLPSVVDVGLASPTGIVFGTHSGFPEPWRSALFACDWAYGKVYAVHLEPNGASFRGRAEVFASGEPFPVTDAVVGSDGALYVTIGGRQVQSGLYRIAWDGAAPPPGPVLPLRDHARQEAAAGLRDLRRSFERLHAERLELEGFLTTDWGALDHPDRFVRHAARIALEHWNRIAGDPLIRKRDAPRANLEEWLALVRSEPTTHAPESLYRASRLFDVTGAREERLDALRLLELALLRLEVGPEERALLRLKLDSHYPSGDARLDRTLLGLLVTLQADVAERALRQLENAATQEERIAVLYALRALDQPWDTALAVRFLEAIERELAHATGGASVRGYLEHIRDEARERTGLAGRTVEAAAADPAPLGMRLVGGATLQPWTLAELEPRLAELASGRDLARGRAAYEAASCASCHRLAGSGENRGPDLTGAAGRYSPRDLLAAILEPSREVPDVWRDTELWSGERLVAVGRVVGEGPEELAVLDAAGTTLRLDPAAIDERRPHRLSSMPEGLLDALAAEEVLDLLAYVLAGG